MQWAWQHPHRTRFFKSYRNEQAVFARSVKTLKKNILSVLSLSSVCIVLTIFTAWLDY